MKQEIIRCDGCGGDAELCRCSTYVALDAKDAKIKELQILSHGLAKDLVVAKKLLTRANAFIRPSPDNDRLKEAIERFVFP